MPAATQDVPLPDGSTATFPADWTPGMIQSKIWDTFPQWRPKGPVQAFTPWNPAEGQGNEAVQDFESYDAMLANRKEQSQLAASQTAEQGPEIAPTDELSFTPPSKRPGPMLSELRPMMEQIASEWGVRLVTGDDLRKANPGSGLDLDAMAETSNKTILEKVRDEAFKRIEAGNKREAILGMRGAGLPPQLNVGLTIAGEAAGGEAVRAVQGVGSAIGHSLTDPVNIAAMAVGAGVPRLALPIYAGFTGMAAGHAAGSIAGNAPLRQRIEETALAATMLLPGASATARAHARANIRTLAADLAPLTTKMVSSFRGVRQVPVTPPAPSPAAPTVVVPQPVTSHLPHGRPSETKHQQLLDAIKNMESAHSKVTESGTVQSAEANQVLSNLNTQLDSLRRASKASSTPANEVSYGYAKKAINEAKAVVIRNQKGERRADPQEVSNAMQAAAIASRSYADAMASAVPEAGVAPAALTPTTVVPPVERPVATPARWESMTYDQRFELLAAKNAAGAAVFSRPELDFANALARDPAELARFNARRLELEAAAKAGTTPPPDQPKPAAPAAATTQDPNALPIQQTGQLLRDVPEQPQQGQGQVPTPVSPGGVPQRGVQGQAQPGQPAAAPSSVAKLRQPTPEEAASTLSPTIRELATISREDFTKFLKDAQVSDYASYARALANDIRTLDHLATLGELLRIAKERGGPAQAEFFDILYQKAQESLLKRSLHLHWQDLTAIREGTTPVARGAAAAARGITHPDDVAFLSRVLDLPIEPALAEASAAAAPSPAFPRVDFLVETPERLQRLSKPDLIALARSEGHSGTGTKAQLAQAAIKHNEFWRRVGSADDAALQAIPREGLQYLMRLLEEPFNAADSQAALAATVKLIRDNLATRRTVAGNPSTAGAAPKPTTAGEAAPTSTVAAPQLTPIETVAAKPPRQLPLSERWKGLSDEALAAEYQAYAKARFSADPVRLPSGADYTVNPSQLTKIIRAMEGELGRRGLPVPGQQPFAAPGTQGVGYFPRKSEAHGLGEPSMPPTVEDVRRQRAEDARAEAPPVSRADEWVPNKTLLQGQQESQGIFNEITETLTTNWKDEFRQAFNYGPGASAWGTKKFEEIWSKIGAPGLGFDQDILLNRLGLIMEKKMGISHLPVTRGEHELVNYVNRVEPKLLEAVENYYTKGSDVGYRIVFDRLRKAGLEGDEIIQLLNDPQLWPQYRQEIYRKDPGAASYIENTTAKSYRPPEMDDPEFQRMMEDAGNRAEAGYPWHEDRGPSRGDPPDIAKQASNQNLALGPAGPSQHGLPPGVNPGPPDFAAHLMAAGDQLNMRVVSDTTLPPNVLGRYLENIEGDRLMVANVRNQRIVAHEMTHGLDARLFPRQAAVKNQPRGLLAARVAPHGVTATATQLYQQLAAVSEFMRGPLDTQYRRRASEVIADWGSLYLHDPVRARLMAPDWTRGFEAALRNHPELQETINQIHARNVRPVAGELGPGVSSVTMKAVVTPDKIGVRPKPVPPPHLLEVAKGAQGFVKDSFRTLEVETQRARVWAENAKRTIEQGDTRPRTYNPAERARRQKEYEDQRKDVGAFVEGSGNIERQGDDSGSNRARVHSNPAMEKLARDYKFAIEHQRQKLDYYLKGIGEGEYLAYLEDYLPHFYVQNEQFGQNLSRFLRDSPNAKARTIPSLAEASRYGFRPITQDPVKLYELYSQVNWQVAVNRRLVEEISNMRTPDGGEVILPSKVAPKNWIPIGSETIFQKYMAYKKPEREVVLWRGSLSAHPDVYFAIRQALEHPIKTSGRVYDYVNSFTRSAAFALSAFHDVSLAMAALGTQFRFKSLNPARGLVRIMERDPVTGLRKGFQFSTRAGAKLLLAEEAVTDAAQHGLRFAWADSELFEYSSRNAVDQTLEFAQKIPGFKDYEPLKRALGWGRRVAELRQRSLWRDTHDALKILAYHDISRKALARAKPGESSTVIKERVASFLNDAFGGQDWQTHFWASPMTRRIWSRFMLAPDWTLSTVRSIPFVNDAATLVRTKVKPFELSFSEGKPRITPGAIPGVYEGLKGNLMRAKFWAAEIAAFGLTSMAMQYALYQFFGDPKEGDHEWMFDNESGDDLLGDTRTNVDVTPFMRALEANGTIRALQDVPVLKHVVPEEKYPTRQYMNMGKRFAEVIRWFLHPFENIESKVSRPIAELTKQLSGQEGMFEAEWKREHTGPEFWKRVKSLASSALPFVFSGNQFLMSQPMKKGMTRYKAQKAFEALYEIQADPNGFSRWFRTVGKQTQPGFPPVKFTTITDGDIQFMMDQVADAAQRNGVNPDEAREEAYDKIKGFHQSAFSKAWVAYDKAYSRNHPGAMKRAMDIMEDEWRYIERLGTTGKGLRQSIENQYRALIPPKPAEVEHVEPRLLGTPVPGQVQRLEMVPIQP